MSVCVLLLQINGLCWLDGLLLLRPAPENRSPNLHAIKCLHFKHFNPLIEKRKLYIHWHDWLFLSLLEKNSKNSWSFIISLEEGWLSFKAVKLSYYFRLSQWVSDEEWGVVTASHVPGACVLGRRHCPIQLSGTRTRRCSPGLSLSQDF